MTGKSPVSGTEPGLSTTGGLLLVIATILLLGALSWGEMVFAPAAFAIFIVMVVWPLQAWLQTRMPKSLAILITILLLALDVEAPGISSIAAWITGLVTISSAAAYAGTFLRGVVAEKKSP